jgi:phosphotransacetylase
MAASTCIDQTGKPIMTETGAHSFPLDPIPTQTIQGARRLMDRVGNMAPLRMAVVHPCDPLSLSGAMDARKARLIVPVLVAPQAKLRALARRAGIDLAGCEIVDVPHSHAAAATAAMMAGKGEVEALMKGSLHTKEFLGAIVARGAGLRTERRISHCYVMETDAYPRPFIITDAAINIAPTLEAKADIVRNAIDLAHALGVAQPRVAILAAVETIHPGMQSTLDAAALCKMADRDQIKGGLLDGPLALDNAVSPDAARVKGIRSLVAGRADILVVPDLESGNMLAKQLEFLGQADSAGIVMGARVPIVLTSRADSSDTRLASCAIALLLVQRRRDAPL